MRTFRNNHKRGRYRNNDRNFKRNGENPKFNSDFSSDSIFQRKSPGISTVFMESRSSNTK